MNLKELTETIILKLVKNTEAVSVEENEEDNQIIINAYVSNEDMGRVIGKDGKIINSIRTILQASSYMQNNISVKLSNLDNDLIYTYSKNNKDYKVIPFSNPDIKTYLDDYERLYDKYSKIVKNMNSDIHVKELTN